MLEVADMLYPSGAIKPGVYLEWEGSMTETFNTKRLRIVRHDNFFTITWMSNLRFSFTEQFPKQLSWELLNYYRP